MGYAENESIVSDKKKVIVEEFLGPDVAAKILREAVELYRREASRLRPR